MGALTSVEPLQPTSPVSQVRSPSAGDTAPRAWAIAHAASPTASSHDGSSTSLTRQISLLISFDLPTSPSPTTALPFRHGRFVTLLHRRDLPRLSPRADRSGRRDGRRRVAIAEQQIEDRKKDLELVKIRVKASQAHQNVLEYTEIADVFGPRGVRARAPWLWAWNGSRST